MGRDVLNRMLRLSRTAGYLLAALLALTQLWDWTSALLSRDLTATVELGAFYQPPPVEKLLDGLQRLPYSPALRSLVDSVSPGLSQQQSADLRDRLIDALSRFVTDKEGQGSSTRPLSWWHVVVRNRGPRAINSVRLFLPNASYALVTRVGAEPRDSAVSGVIDLGSLQPREALTVIGWAGVRTAAGERVTVTHDRGVGSVTVRRPAGRAGQLLDRHGSALLVLAAAGTLFVGLMFLDRRIRLAARRKARLTSPPPGPPVGRSGP